jgi:Tol biopolymer transport system component
VPPATDSQIVSIDVTSGVREQLTSGPGVKVTPQFVNDEVAYVIKAGPHAGLARTRSGLETKGVMRNPSWTADGKRVVYQKFLPRTLKQNLPLYSMYPKEFEFAWTNPFPAFSRAGKLVVTTDFAFRTASLSIMKADGDLTPIFVGKTGVATAASWSPDEKWIVFAFGTYLEGKAKPSRLMMMRPDGSEAHEFGPPDSGLPSFSRDGKSVVYQARGGQERGLRIMEISGGSSRTLTTEEDTFPVWSPTEDVVLFTRTIDDGYSLFSIHTDGTHLKRLTPAPGNSAHGAWSPDGKHILFSSTRLGWRDEAPLYDASGQAHAELFVMNADGSHALVLTQNKWEDATPAWQP